MGFGSAALSFEAMAWSLRNYRDNFIASGICREGKSTWKTVVEHGEERLVGKKFFLRNKPTNPYGINKNNFLWRLKSHQ